ncbi:MAG: cytochrome c3 family protein [Thermoanaerobaculia bacterium]
MTCSLGGVLGLTLALGLLAMLAVEAPPVSAQEGEPVDASVCAACHEDQVSAFESNPHALLDDPDWGAHGVEGGSCVSCHAGAEGHVEEGGGEGNVFAFGEEEPARAKTEACMECHGDVHPRFFNSEHAKAGVSCVECHSVHHEEDVPPVDLLQAGSMVVADPADELDRRSQVCAECHGDVITQFQFNERHRLNENILSCVSCHDPHAPETRTRLAGFKQETCLECHTDKGGPFIFEHAASRVEGCVACHDPHGSPNRHMLQFQRTAELCFSCHAAVPGFHSRFTLDTVCTNCHSTIHGSNFDPFFLK